MTSAELLSVIANGENSGVEFRRDDIRPEALAKELVAFLNLEGGVVLLGVEDNGTVSGTTRDRIEEWVMAICRDKIKPAVIPYFEQVIEPVTGHKVAVVRVSRGATVSAQSHEQQLRYYIRVGSTCREADPAELQRLFQQRSLIRAELSPISGAALKDLDMRRLKDYFIRVRDQEAPADDSPEEWRRLLYNTEFLVDDGVTMAALLLFGIRPNRHLPQAGIDAVAYPGTEKDYAARERTTIRGPIVPLIRHDGAIEEHGLIEHAIAFVRRNTHVEGGLEEGSRRVERWDYPESAVREAIVNAVVHRDYLLFATNIELSIYSDRLEVVSPGRLPNGMTPERLRAGNRASRNELIKDVMRDYRYVESMGMGVRRKIVAGMRAHNGTEPGLLDEHERFTVTLYK